MKQLSGILLLFLVAVVFTTAPTSYAYGCSQGAKEKTAKSAEKQSTHAQTYHHTSDADSHKNHSCPVGGCGDNCNCGCACVHSQNSVFIDFGIKSFISTLLLEGKLPEMQRNLALQSYHTDIWQPPKC